MEINIFILYMGVHRGVYEISRCQCPGYTAMIHSGTTHTEYIISNWMFMLAPVHAKAVLPLHEGRGP